MAHLHPAASRQNLGFTLIEVLMVIGLIAIIAAAVIVPMSDSTDEGRYQVTIERMKEIREAIVGKWEPQTWTSKSSHRKSFGYVGDMGILPLDLKSLWTAGPAWKMDSTAHIGTGWNGPYLSNQGFFGTDYQQDAWGTHFDYKLAGTSATLISYGSDRAVDTVPTTGFAKDIILQIPSALTESTIHGVILNGTSPWSGNAEIEVNQPDGAGGLHQTITPVNPAQEGAFIFPSSMGTRSATIYIPNKAAPTTTAGPFIFTADRPDTYVGPFKLVGSNNLDASWAPQWSKILGLWHMDEASWSGTPNEIIDSSPRLFNGQAFLSATTAGGLINNAGTFDGVKAYARILVGDKLNGTFTIQFWVKPTVFTNGTDYSFFSYGGNTPSGFNISRESSANKLRISWNGPAPGSTESYDGPVFTTTGSWSHIVVTVSSGVPTMFYVNGVPTAAIKSGASGPALSIGIPTLLEIGRTSNPMFPGGTQNFDGLIDEVAIWRSALSYCEVETIYYKQAGLTNPIGTLCNGLAAGYHMEEATNKTAPGGTDFFDFSGNGAHGRAGAAGAVTYAVPGENGNAIGLIAGTIINMTHPTATIFSGNVATVSMWIQWDSTLLDPVVGGYLFSFDHYGSLFNPSGWIGISTDNGGDYYSGDFAAPATNWLHVTTEIHDGDATLGQVWINGTKSTMSDTPTQSTGNALLSPTFHLNCLGATNSQCFSGTIDEVYIWNRTLTDAEVTKLDTFFLP